METKEKATISRQILSYEDKDSNFMAQRKRVRLSFSERPKTMLEVSIETGILRANICRYVRAMESKGEIQCVRKSHCPVSHHKAGFYSTGEALFTKSNVQQLNFFDYERL